MKRKERTPLQNLRLARRPPTLHELAGEMGYDYGYIGRFERGLVKRPSDDFINKYLRAMRRFGIALSRPEVMKALEDSQTEKRPPRRPRAAA